MSEQTTDLIGEVPFKGHLIRYARVDELPWYSLDDVCAVLGVPACRTLNEEVAACHHLDVVVTINGHPTELAVISPIGLFTLTLYRHSLASVPLQMWMWKETRKLRPDAFDREKYGPVQCMALRPDGDVPPRPHWKTGRADEWEGLRALPGYISPKRRQLRAYYAALREQRTTHVVASTHTTETHEQNV